MTILDVCVEVLKESDRPLAADELCSEIERRKLYSFNAKSPSSIIRGTLRKHLRGSPPYRVRQVDSRRFEAV